MWCKGITKGLHGNRGSMRSERYHEVGGQHRGKGKERLIVKIKLRQGFVNGPFPQVLCSRFSSCFVFFFNMYFFLCL